MDQIRDEIQRIMDEADRVLREKKMPVAEMARRSGSSTRSWMAWRSGRYAPTLYPLLMLLHTLGLDLKLTKYSEEDRNE